MSLLAPLFALGALAIAAPVLFHLIRRSPQGRMPFSSLMFLSPSPPRLTRRSRLDNLLLLLLRAAALGLLAFAFARPFLREAAALDRGEAERQRVVILLDTSASMRRADLWNQATAKAQEIIASLKPQDEFSVIAFDDAARPLASFAELATLEPAQRKSVAAGRLDEINLSWRSTDLGAALLEAVAQVNEGLDQTEQAARGARRIVLVSDLAQGSRTDALIDFQWPRDVALELQSVATNDANASASLLEDSEDTSDDESTDLRVRVTNDQGAKTENLQLEWLDADGKPAAGSIAVYVPPGESRVARVPRPAKPGEQRRLRLRGDAQDFDNTLYVASRPAESREVVYLGADRPADATAMLYYAERALAATSQSGVTVRAAVLETELTPLTPRVTPLVILTGETSAANRDQLRKYLEAGGTVLCVLGAAGEHETLAALASVETVESTEGNAGEYKMLTDIAFDHPLFAPLAGPQYNDFTKIHFWKYRRLADDALGDAQVVARLEGGDPAVVEKRISRGHLIVLTSGWQPGESQLARSSKFVPLMTAMLDRGRAPMIEGSGYEVGERVLLPAREERSAQLVVRKPDGTTKTLDAAAAEYFTETEEPGVYAIETPEETQYFAVNVAPRESRVAPLPAETLEQWGSPLTSETRRAQEAEQLRQLRDVELEGRQKIWQWLVVAVLAVLIVETWLAGRLSRPSLNQAEGLAT